MGYFVDTHIQATSSDRPTRIAYNSVTGLEEYVGIAAHGGVASSDACWQIKKLHYDSSNRVDRIEFAGNATGFVSIWDNRASYTYGPSGDTI